MQTVAIVGVGLIGGSFALALKKAGFGGRIIGVSSPQDDRGGARARGDRRGGHACEQAVPVADLVYLAQPISRILDTIEEIDPLLQPGALVTDAGSTKSEIVGSRRALHSSGPVPGRPPHGRQGEARRRRGGPGSVRRPHLRSDAARALRTWRRPPRQRFWNGSAGSAPCPWCSTPPSTIASCRCTSHLPQLASTALAATLARHLDLDKYCQVAGPGLDGHDPARHEFLRYLARYSGHQLRTGSNCALDAYISELNESALASQGRPNCVRSSRRPPSSPGGCGGKGEKTDS